jgi:hypothetical protein
MSSFKKILCETTHQLKLCSEHLGQLADTEVLDKLNKEEPEAYLAFAKVWPVVSKHQYDVKEASNIVFC